MYKTTWKSVLSLVNMVKKKTFVVPGLNHCTAFSSDFKEYHCHDVIKLPTTNAITRDRTSEEMYARRRLWLIPFVIASRFAICELRRLMFSCDVNESALKCVCLRCFAEVASEPFSLCSPNAYKYARSVFDAIFVYR